VGARARKPRSGVCTGERVCTSTWTGRESLCAHRERCTEVSGKENDIRRRMEGESTKQRRESIRRRNWWDTGVGFGSMCASRHGGNECVRVQGFEGGECAGLEKGVSWYLQKRGILGERIEGDMLNSGVGRGVLGERSWWGEVIRREDRQDIDVETECVLTTRSADRESRNEQKIGRGGSKEASRAKRRSKRSKSIAGEKLAEEVRSDDAQSWRML
jgi:hypothetical protein